MSKKSNDDARSPLLASLMKHHVVAEVAEVDHYRIRGGMAVETDYIICVRYPEAASKSRSPNTKEQKLSSTTSSSSSFASKSTPVTDEEFDPFTISKTYSAFRTLAHQLKKAADNVTKSSPSLDPAVVKIAKYCELVTHLVESQRTQYLGKVNYMYVKVLSNKRRQIINEVLQTTCAYFPTEIESHPLLQEVVSMVETFFLTDHLMDSYDGGDVTLEKGTAIRVKTGFHRKTTSTASSVGEKNHERHASNPLSWIPFPGSGSDNKKTDEKNPSRRASVVVPITHRSRRPKETRVLDEEELTTVGEDAHLLLDDDRPQTELVPSYARPVPVVRSGGSKIGVMIENNPLAFLAIAAAVVYGLHLASRSQVTMDADIALLTVFACFCLGLHTPRPMVGGFDRPPTMKGSFRQDGADRSGRMLLRRSMISSSPRNSAGIALAGQEEMMSVEEQHLAMGSPMAMFPKGAKIGSHNNCWSVPDFSAFDVRGANYLKDKKKIPSGEFIFPVRGVDLFLTDTCPENVGSNSSVFGGNLRDLPTFIINFRLPWGVLVFYFEIPKRFLPFLQAGYETDFDKSKLPDMKKMTPGDRTVSRFLMANKEQKNCTIKIVPFVVDGPWITRQVVGGKPALIGKKVPTHYVYQPAEDGKAMYLEADLDIAASSAARGILSVARTYTQVLTLDIGFVIQGNSNDELPEQMMVGSRLHGIDPLTAMPFPATADTFVDSIMSTDDNESVTPNM
jgi:hypothetical protein